MSSDYTGPPGNVIDFVKFLEERSKEEEKATETETETEATQEKYEQIQSTTLLTLPEPESEPVIFRYPTSDSLLEFSERVRIELFLDEAHKALTSLIKSIKDLE